MDDVAPDGQNPGPETSKRQPFLAGFAASVPLAIPAMPIGILLGVAIRDSEVVGSLAGWSSGWMIFAGAAQFAAIDLLDRGAGVLAVVAAIFMINARHLMYSAALSTGFKEAPLWFKVIGSYLLIDQAFALNGDHAPGLAGRTVHYRIWHFFGTVVPMATVWPVTIAAGLWLGQLIPPEWEVDFAIPLMFLGLMVMSIANGPGLVAAVVGGTVAVAGREWPSGTGLVAGAVLGVAVAGLLDRAFDRGRADPEPAPGPGGPGPDERAAV
ncbi:MAG: AzlC family ABC transporter permease [Acidimicrobiia bacterium]|nr:AzlC family ABC transporter permease [Acidimicrobiia bacterium]